MGAGTAIHEGYQKYLETHDKAASTWAFMRAFPVHLNWDSSDDRSMEACLNTLDALINASITAEYELSTIKTLQGVLMPAIEVPFEIEFPGLVLANGMTLSFIGYIDMIMYSRFYDMHGVVDLKTHRNNRSDLTANYLHHGQMIPYGLILNHVLGKSITRFNVIYASAFIDILEPRVETYEYEKTQADIEDWITSFVIGIKNLNEMLKLDHFPRTENGCLIYNKACTYLDICKERNKDKLQSILLCGEEPRPSKRDEFEPWIKIQLSLPVDL